MIMKRGLSIKAILWFALSCSMGYFFIVEQSPSRQRTFTASQFVFVQSLRDAFLTMCFLLPI